jgi:hypothetical protein
MSASNHCAVRGDELVQSGRGDKLFRDLVKEHGEYSARLGLVVAGRTKVYTAYGAEVRAC